MARLPPRPSLLCSLRSPALLTTVALAAGAMALDGCSMPVTRTRTATLVGSNVRLPESGNPERKDPELPLAVFGEADIRQALRDIAARQRLGDGSQVTTDYAARMEGNRCLENRLLMVATETDPEKRWDLLHALTTEQPRFAWAHLLKVAVYTQWKIRDQAERELGLAEKHSPNLGMTRTLRGDLLRAVGDPAGAVAAYEEALALDATDAEARTGRAVARQALGQTDELEAELRQALKDLPTHYEAAETLARFLDEAKRDTAATFAWEKVLELAPRNRAARLAVARLTGDLDPTAAILSYEKAATLSPLNASEMDRLAALYRRAERTDDELKTLNKLFKLDDKNPAPLRRIGEIHEQRGDDNAAESSYSTLRGLNAKEPVALEGLARLAEKRAKLRMAMELYAEARDAGSTAAAEQLARLKSLCRVPTRPVTGKDLTALYRNVLDELMKLYEERLTITPDMTGSLRARVTTDGKGKLLSVDVIENGTGDARLEAQLQFTLREAGWPAMKEAANRPFTLKFDLPPE